MFTVNDFFKKFLLFSTHVLTQVYKVPSFVRVRVYVVFFSPKGSNKKHKTSR